jgi:tRNA(fMet)-specific endonuclease VapC
MTLYLLDTDICSYVMKRSHEKLIEKLRVIPLEEIAISVITEAELLYELQISPKPKLVRASFDAFIKHVSVREWTSAAAQHYAEIRANLHKRGQLIGANDLMIAAHASSLQAILVTNNQREFGRVRGLAVENWTK